MNTIKQIMYRVNIFRRLRDQEQLLLNIATAHNTVETKQRLILEHFGYVVAVSKFGKPFLRKKKPAAPVVKRKYTKRAK